MADEVPLRRQGEVALVRRLCRIIQRRDLNDALRKRAVDEMVLTIGVAVFVLSVRDDRLPTSQIHPASRR